jgi:hypothetical protein
MTTVISSSSKEIMADPARLIEAMRAGSIIQIADLDYTVVPTKSIAELADERAEEELLEELVSYRKDVTGIENTVFISPKGNTRHGPRIDRSAAVRRSAEQDRIRCYCRRDCCGRRTPVPASRSGATVHRGQSRCAPRLLGISDRYGGAPPAAAADPGSLIG